MSKQRLLFITTGGTIASVRTAQGLKPVLTSEELLAHLPELQQLCCPETLNLCSIDSTDPVSYTHLDVYKRQMQTITPA